MDNNKINQIESIMKNTQRVYRVIFGLLLILMALMILLPSDMKSGNTGEQMSWYMQSVIGFFVLVIASSIMHPEVVRLMRKVRGLQTFGTLNRTYGPTFSISVGLFLIIIMIKAYFIYVPYAGSIVFGSFVLGCLYLMKRLTKTKSATGKVLLYVLALIILFGVSLIFSLTYLTREG